MSSLLKQILPHRVGSLGRGLLAIGVLAGLLTAAHVSRGQPVASKIPNKVVLVTPIDRKLPDDMQRLLVWPSVSEIKRMRAVRDISDRLPPVFPKNAIKDAKPIKVGGVSPKAALDEAHNWLRRALKQEWLPIDLRARLIPLRHQAPEWSRVIVRYRISRYAIQAVQTRWGIGFVIKATDGEFRDDSESFANEVFREVFTDGAQMAKLAARRTSLADGRVSLSVRNDSEIASPAPLLNWWGWEAWYTDGTAIAVVMRKRLHDEEHTIQPDEPWF